MDRMRLRALRDAATVKWVLWAIAGASHILAAVSFVPPNPSPFWGVLFLFVGQVILLAVDGFIKRRTRAEWMEDWFGSFENFRASLDTEELGRLKQERGPAKAVLWMRREFPHVPAARIRELVDGL